MVGFPQILIHFLGIRKGDTEGTEQARRNKKFLYSKEKDWNLQKRPKRIAKVKLRSEDIEKKKVKVKEMKEERDTDEREKVAKEGNEGERHVI